MTKLTEEIIEAAIVGETIQFRIRNNLWCDYNDITSKILMDIAADDSNIYEYRVKPKFKKIQYRNFIMEYYDSGTIYVHTWNDKNLTNTTQSDVENLPTFIKWIGETTEVEIEV
jgi:mevalonate pyrophosphate decarboxylase